MRQSGGFVARLNDFEDDWRDRSACGRWLADVSLRGSHGFAALFAMMVLMRHAPHRLAALHRLLGGGSWAAIESVRR